MSTENLTDEDINTLKWIYEYLKRPETIMIPLNIEKRKELFEVIRKILNKIV